MYLFDLHIFRCPKSGQTSRTGGAFAFIVSGELKEATLSVESRPIRLEEGPKRCFQGFSGAGGLDSFAQTQGQTGGWGDFPEFSI